MKITKRQLKRLIIEEKLKFLRENYEDHEVSSEMPCPIATADALKQAGATDSDVLNWLHELTMELASIGGDIDVHEVPMDLDAMGGEEAFGIGHQIGNEEL
jgi:hypothetical protein|tara:strand:- start:3535 stop:3837 length:303 start_codon:yes stop_codon:yes gene_type:complete